ncbi:MAG: hypothetical protein ACN4GW_09510, partial [Desulforhopalus sp.]
LINVQKNDIIKTMIHIMLLAILNIILAGSIMIIPVYLQQGFSSKFPKILLLDSQNQIELICTSPSQVYAYTHLTVPHNTSAFSPAKTGSNNTDNP